MRAVCILLLGCVLPALSLPLERRTVTTQVLDNLVFCPYTSDPLWRNIFQTWPKLSLTDFKYASSAYSVFGCPKPNGNTLVKEFSSLLTDTQGFVARDDDRKEIVISLRGSSSIQDFVTDVDIFLTDYKSPGVTAPSGTKVHSGFLAAYNSVANIIISVVRDQLKSHPDYTLVTTGHSLGGALSSLAAASLKGNFPSTAITMYTYGQPRTGNSAYASWINDQFGPRVFRGVHTSDGVPTIIPKLFGYRHHGVEYWSNPDPTSTAHTKQCAPDGEDPTCSDSIPSTGINIAHGVYYG